MKKRYNTWWLSIGIWAIMASQIFIFPDLLDLVNGMIVSNSDKFQSKGASYTFSIFLVGLPSYLLVLFITILMRHWNELPSIRGYWRKRKTKSQGKKTLPNTKAPFWKVIWWLCYWVFGTLWENIRKKWRKVFRATKIISFLIVIIAFSLNLNAQNSESIILNDSEEIHPEFYEFKYKGIQVRFTTFVQENGRDNMLLIDILGGFDEEYSETLFVRLRSFEGLEKEFGGSNGKESFRQKIREDLKIYLLIKDKTLIMLGEFLDEEGYFKGYFRIRYPVENLLLNRMDGEYPGSIEYLSPKVYAENCKVIKLDNDSFNYEEY